MPVRMKLPRLEAKKKQVIVAETFRDPKGYAQNDDISHAIDRIRTCISNGTPLPSTFYSKGAGIRPDEMLDNYGIMHLHLGDWRSNELLWIVQYPEHVLFLELSDHQPFATNPRGIRLFRYHSGAIRLKEASMDANPAGGGMRMTYGERREAGLVKPPKKPGT